MNMKKLLLAAAFLSILIFALPAQAATDGAHDAFSEPLPMTINPVVPIVPSTATAGFVNIGNVAFGTNTFTDTTNCKPSTTCSYEVTAFNSSNESAPSNIVTVTWGASNKGTILAWTPATAGGTPTGYNIYFLAGPGAPTGLTGTLE